jgi:Glyoxalase-like domain
VHRSRMGSVVIDCDDFEAGIRFWAGALGVAEEAVERGDRYASLGAVAGSLRLLIQRVPESKAVKTRVHLDIETDDVAAEVARLERLGAHRHQDLGEGGWVLLDVCGNEFCVVEPETPGFPERALVWAPEP